MSSWFSWTNHWLAPLDWADACLVSNAASSPSALARLKSQLVMSVMLMRPLGCRLASGGSGAASPPCHYVIMCDVTVMELTGDECWMGFIWPRPNDHDRVTNCRHVSRPRRAVDSKNHVQSQAVVKWNHWTKRHETQQGQHAQWLYCLPLLLLLSAPVTKAWVNIIYDIKFMVFHWI